MSMTVRCRCCMAAVTSDMNAETPPVGEELQGSVPGRPRHDWHGGPEWREWLEWLAGVSAERTFREADRVPHVLQPQAQRRGDDNQ